jgi:hypothetical protein
MRSLLLWLPLLSTSTIIQIGGCPIIDTSKPPGNGTPSARASLADGFESGLADWVQDQDLPLDPNRPGQTVAASVTLSTAQAYGGARSARFAIDGTQGDGTVWLEHQFSVLGDQNYRVTLTFAFWSESQSDNAVAFVAAIGTNERPKREQDFDTSRVTNLTAGWRQYSYTFDLTTDATGRVWVGYGVTVAFETQLIYYIDDVSITIEPR